MSEIFNRWEWELSHDPKTLWPKVADTDRFNRDTLLPTVEVIQPGDQEEGLDNGRRRLKMAIPFLNVTWDEDPFEWSYPNWFRVVRRYRSGPLKEMRVQVQLRPTPSGGTHLIYDTWITPRNLLGRIGWPAVAQASRYLFGQAFNRYDEEIETPVEVIPTSGSVKFSSGGRQRLLQTRNQLQGQVDSDMLLDKLYQLLLTGDEHDLAQMKPYAYADQWGYPRHDVLNLFLLATRVGMLELQWNVLCPHCRGSMAAVSHLAEIPDRSGCDICQIDFDINFDRYVEVTFSPNNSIRPVEHMFYCMAGPERTPHIALQRLVGPGASLNIRPLLDEGRYRLRTLRAAGSQPLLVNQQGAGALDLGIDQGGWPKAEAQVRPGALMTLINATDREQLFILEHRAWGDDAVTAAEITTMQQFRDLFAEEALRPGDQFSVGSLAILFTDIKGSTQLYREVGDAAAFGMVLDHFDVVKEEILAENGAIVKTIGDAVMAVFLQPAAAIRAMLSAQERLSMPPYGKRPLTLKAALHYGPAIAVNLNERLDYFGSTINQAARLEKFSLGNDIVLSAEVVQDPVVQALLQERQQALQIDCSLENLRGFEGQFEVWRVQPRQK